MHLTVPGFSRLKGLSFVKTAIRPYLESGIQELCPWQIPDVELLDNVQMMGVCAMCYFLHKWV